jgi:hypothetical protein
MPPPFHPPWPPFQLPPAAAAPAAAVHAACGHAAVRAAATTATTTLRVRHVPAPTSAPSQQNYYKSFHDIPPSGTFAIRLVRLGAVRLLADPANLICIVKLHRTDRKVQHTNA